jgi:hypothetical protein
VANPDINRHYFLLWIQHKTSKLTKSRSRREDQHRVEAERLGGETSVGDGALGWRVLQIDARSLAAVAAARWRSTCFLR